MHSGHFDHNLQYLGSFTTMLHIYAPETFCETSDSLC